MKHLPPGRELDALIAEKVIKLTPGYYFMEFKDLSQQEQNNYNRNQGWSPMRCPEYSTDIAAAWEVVERMRMIGADLEITIGKMGYAINYELEDNWGVHGYKDTAPHAICLAALKAVSYEV